VCSECCGVRVISFPRKLPKIIGHLHMNTDNSQCLTYKVGAVGSGFIYLTVSEISILNYGS